MESEALILGDTKKLSKQDQQYFNTLFFKYLFVQLSHVSVVRTGSSLWDVESFHCVWAPEIQGQNSCEARV